MLAKLQYSLYPTCILLIGTAGMRSVSKESEMCGHTVMFLSAVCSGLEVKQYDNQKEPKLYFIIKPGLR